MSAVHTHGAMFCSHTTATGNPPEQVPEGHAVLLRHLSIDLLLQNLANYALKHVYVSKTMVEIQRSNCGKMHQIMIQFSTVGR